MSYGRTQQVETFNSLISVPFVRCKFGGVEFGLVSEPETTSSSVRMKVRKVTGLTALKVSKKASGQVNTYTATLQYVIQPGSDPNYIDYIISNAPNRKITFSYGDLAQPTYSFKDEEALITKIEPSISIANNVITYTITATSSSVLEYSNTQSFSARSRTKPSSVIWELLNSNKGNILSLFTGMRDLAKVKDQGWIATTDSTVNIEAKTNITPLEYIRYLVSIMTSSTSNTFYSMVISDEPTLGENADGPYFRVVDSEQNQSASTIYSVDIDVGYPSETPVIEFTPSQNTSIALINQFSETFDIGGENIININAKGEAAYETAAPNFAIKNGRVDSQLSTWWKNLTNYPINATLKTRGLIKPAILCEYLKINVLFFGQRYNYSGLYMVTAQEDDISESGYTSELTLVRVGGDE